jgi:SAM-dependent methyltransferase
MQDNIRDSTRDNIQNTQDDCVFNEDYYENGLKLGISGYENYHYIPWRSYSEATELINRFKFNSILDYGCSKGFLVHALRQLNKDAYGEDISDYAISHCFPDVQIFISKPTQKCFDFIFSKDTLEHIDENCILKTLTYLNNRCKQALFVLPLGDCEVFRIKEYSIDKTHITIKDEDWWIDMFRLSGFKLKSFAYSMGAIKKHWLPINEYGNGFFTVRGNL